MLTSSFENVRLRLTRIRFAGSLGQISVLKSVEVPMGKIRSIQDLAIIILLLFDK